MSQEDELPLMDVTIDSDNFTEFRDALERRDSSALQLAVKRLPNGEVNRSFTHAADEVFRIPASNLPQEVQEDLSQQDFIRICAVHLVVMRGDHDSLEVLVDGGADLNVKDSFGQTALHILPKCDWKYDTSKFERCLDILLAHDEIKMNRLDLSRSTPMSRAEEVEWSYMTDKIRKKRDLAGDTASSSTHGIQDDLLWQYLLEGNLEDFKSTLESANDNTNISISNESHGSYTLLQYACRFGMLDFVSELLTHEASPTYKHDINMLSPVMWAAKFGRHRILLKLIESMKIKDMTKGALTESDDNSETPLHYVVKCEYSKMDPEVNYYQCLQILLNMEKYVNADVKKYIDTDGKKYIDIDAKNDVGNTALHFAAHCGDLNAFTTLLKKGANSTVKDYSGYTPLQYINKEGMITILNDCVEYDKQRKVNDPDFWISVNYQMMNIKVNDEGISEGSAGSSNVAYLQNCNVATEMKFLNLVAGIYKDKDILHHPVLQIFMLLKWHNIRKFFILEFALHIVFLVLLLPYICIYHSSLPTSEKKNMYPPGRIAFIVILLLILWLRVNLGEFIMQRWKVHLLGINFITKFVNIVLTCMLFFPWDDKTQISFAVFLIIISLLEFILQFEHFPCSSVYIVMLKTVAWKFLMFILIFSIIIWAFCLSFYLVFQASEEFRTFQASVVKTIVMTTGEIDYGNLPVSKIPVVSHLLVVFFVYLITLVLMNLLNGLAIGDILYIKKEAEVISCKGQIDRMEELERAFFRSQTGGSLKDIFDWLFGKTLTFKTCLPQHRLTIHVNRRPIQYTLSDETKDLYLCKCHKYKLKTEQIKALKYIVLKKRRGVR